MKFNFNTKPIKDFIPRNRKDGTEEILNQFADGLNELVNFGSNIFKWDISQPHGSDEFLPSALFFRNFIEQIDAISILIRNYSCDPCFTLLRTALENLYYIEYLLEKDTNRRSKSFLFWNSINKIKLYYKLTPETDVYKQLKSDYKKDKLINGDIPDLCLDMNELKSKESKYIDSPKYKEIKEEYNRVKGIGKKNPEWYSLFGGANNLEGLARMLGHSASYQTFYRGFSGSTHGTDIIQGKISFNEKNQAAITAIRHPKSAQQVTSHCFNFCVILFTKYFNKRIPEKKNEFNKWYLSIQEFYLALGNGDALIFKE